MARKAAKKTKESRFAKGKAPVLAKGKGAKKPAVKTPAAKKAAAKKSASRTKTEKMIADVRELVELMTSNDITEIHMQDGDMKIVLRRGEVRGSDAAGEAMAPAVAGTKPFGLGEGEAEPSNDLLDVVSPMVGTFYASAGLDSDPYVSVNSDVAEDTVVCIVEAMKVMNEIKAECSGTIVEVCVKNAQPVEFGQLLFRVRSA